MAKELMKISVETKPNGYSLDINGTGFFYFNELDLLAGFLTHIGLSEKKELERTTMLTMLFEAMLGETYNSNVEKLKKTIEMLQNKSNDMDKDIVSLQKGMPDMMKKADELKALLEEVKKTIKEANKLSKNELEQKLSDNKDIK